MKEYRIIKFYFPFFARYAYRLEKRAQFLWAKYWITVETDHLGIRGEDWARHYNCPVIEEKV